MCNGTCYCASHDLLIIYIQKAGIDVVRALFPWNFSQFHTWEVIYGRNSKWWAWFSCSNNIVYHLQGKIFPNLFWTRLQGLSAALCEAWGCLLKDCSKRETSQHHAQTAIESMPHTLYSSSNPWSPSWCIFATCSLNLEIGIGILICGTEKGMQLLNF